MADKDIKIDIHTQAKGDGAKKTAADIDRLRQSSKQAADTASGLRAQINSLDDISEDARRELHKTADEIDRLGRRAAKAATIAGKLAKGLDLTEEESGQLAASLDKTRAATEGLERQQRRANKTARETGPAMDRAAKGKRNMGLAALEASRAVEDMQYGMRGVLNNIPQMVLMLGGSAGLTAVISLLAVGLTQLIPLLVSEADQTKLNARVAEDAARKKIAAARAEREAARDAMQDVELHRRIINAESKEVLKAVSNIDKLTAARRRAFEAQQAINNEELSLNIAVISADDSLSDIEKLAAIQELKRDAELEKQRAAREQRLAEIEAEKRQLDMIPKEVDDLMDKREGEKFSLDESIRKNKRDIEELTEAARKLQEQLEKVSIPALDKTLNNEAAANFLNPFSNGTLKAPDRSDFESDKAFVLKTREMVENKDEGPHLKSTASHLESVERQMETLDAIRKQIGQLEREGKAMVSKRGNIDGQIERLRAAREKELVQSREKIQLLSEELEKEERLAEIRNKRTAVLDTAAAKRAAGSDISRELSELQADAGRELREAGATTDQVRQAREAISAIGEQIAQAKRDGIDPGEFRAIQSSLADLGRGLGRGLRDTNTNIRQLLSAVDAHRKQNATLRSEIRDLRAAMQAQY